jgi:FkbM family methyltransferase
MGKAAGSVSIIFNKCPDKVMASNILRDIASRDAASPPDIIGKDLVLYGAGNLGRMAKDYLNHIGVPFRYVVDANSCSYIDDPAWIGTTIIAPGDVSKSDKESAVLAVCISTIPYAPLFQSLSAQGWQDIIPFYDITESYCDRHPLSNGWFADSLSDEDITSIIDVLNRWDDDVSRAHHLQFIAWRYLREEWVFDGAPVTIDDRYFIPQVKFLLKDKETFFDIGAHHGEVSIKFSELMSGKFNEILAVEPDSTNLEILTRNLRSYFQDNFPKKIHILDYVIGDLAVTGNFFTGLDYASQISGICSRAVQIQTLDEMKIPPTFIKLHIEGSELAAIKGGLKTIRNFEPIIAATAYHNRLGLWEFPFWLMNNIDNYRFMLRLHGWCGTGLVVYAIPSRKFFA